MFRKVLIANRGAIACRIIRTLRKMQVAPVAIYSEADVQSLHVSQAAEAICVGPASAALSYLNVEAVLAAAKQSGAEAIHPGYGFLSENAEFAEACERVGIVFIGPTPLQMRQFGLKHTARELAERASVPLLPGTGILDSALDAMRLAAGVGYPVMLKSTAGGGGIGMRLCRSAGELREAFDAVSRLSETNFKQGGLFLEKFVERARHIEVQIFGDGLGNVIDWGERDCSVQRRNQKVIEETPAPGLDPAVRDQLRAAAVALARTVAYRSAGTVEFVYDADVGRAYFLEVNTRLQVEHGVTEAVTGLDLVECMVQLAAKELPPLDSLRREPQGHSLQVRVYAEDAAKQFQPSAGLLTQVALPPDTRCETWVETGTEVSAFYDPLLAKIIVHGATRAESLTRMQTALAATRFSGIESNLEYLRFVVGQPAFAAGGVTTQYLNTLDFHTRALQILEPGTMTTVQDFPGRLGFWNVGVPPSGPMDPVSFRAGNRLLGNADSAAGLECTLSGPSIRFTTSTAIVLTGTHIRAELDGQPVPYWTCVPVHEGSVLRMGAAEGPGMRAYLTVEGGIAVPSYLGSQSTFTLGRFGGHGGRALRTGDVLHLDTAPRNGFTPCKVQQPRYRRDWSIGVMYGPHGAPDFFTEDDMRMFFATRWRVHYNSSRTGVRLIGPKPVWARRDGGEAGLHPSNIHDNAYAIGAIDFTGDMPVILGPDGPSLGGFVCPATIVHAELWKMGQLHPDDSVQFVPLTLDQATQLDSEVENWLTDPSHPFPDLPLAAERAGSAVLITSSKTPKMVCRPAGDRSLLIEFGDAVLDLGLRLRAHVLMEWLAAQKLKGIIDLTPGIRSLQVHYDSCLLPRDALVKAVQAGESLLPELDDLELPSRIVHLPLSWDDPATRLAIEKYQKSVRADAPWCPSNIEFIRRINGLGDVADVYRTVFDASYLVLGLGDVYLGAPVATPLDPRHRLVTTKYNPARTWTPENAVGIGGAYLCIYGMEGPGGYQFVGRTIQMWNTWRATKVFPAGHPWLLSFFDQIRFEPVSAKDLLSMREAFPLGRMDLDIRPATLSYRAYRAELAANQSAIAAFKAKQQEAFEAERERWSAAGVATFEESSVVSEELPEDVVPEGSVALRSPASGSVWNVSVQGGEAVESGQMVIVVEAMKMEIAITAPARGTITELRCAPGSAVTAGQIVGVLHPC